MSIVARAARPRRWSAAVTLAVLPLAGCISFGSKPPASLLTLTATAAPAVGQEQRAATARSITIDVPVAPQAVATTRVPVAESPTSLTYIRKAQWAEPPTRLFARLLADTVAARTGRVVVSSIQAVNDPSAHLAGELRFVGVDAATRQAVVTFDAALVRVPAGTAPGSGLDKKRFEARVPVASIDADGAGPALNDAANQVAAQVADWVGR